VQIRDVDLLSRSCRERLGDAGYDAGRQDAGEERPRADEDEVGAFNRLDRGDRVAALVGSTRIRRMEEDFMTRSVLA